ncbi:high affinity cationic amino acid transporter 1 isoform X1 [Nematostella vectensis]|uniref:high affinity cationic amino acid transporter 1 isoform X1 n=1 Tax=Nematostella vectensis TaxID=45351 RepID=UPI0020773121|nr:high affinity cationic amino acid transporter 1 isoform X1 [Nematostella vectensis]XP_032237944.2 high affinity cationic amino acid transporter 1 isoform X1 [Nematostella vectensis]
MAELTKSALTTISRKKIFAAKDYTKTELSRCLSKIDLAGLGIASTLGAGIYVLAGIVAKNIAGPGLVLSFLIAGIASLMSALCYAEFGSRVPRAGSAYVYSYVAIGEFCAFVVGWNMILEYLIGASSLARGCTEYLDALFNGQIREYSLKHIGSMNAPLIAQYPDFLAFAIALIVTIPLALGAAMTTRTNNVITAINLIVITFITLVGLSFADRKNWNNFLPYGFSGVVAGAATCFFSFVGFDCIATSAEEAKNPTKDVPIAILITIGICFVAYFGVSAALTLMWPYNLLPAQGALPKVFALRGAPWAQYLIAAGALCGLTASLIGALFPLPRLLYAMASDGLIFTFLARIHPRTEIPIFATVIAGVLAAVLALLFELQELVEMMSIGTLLAYTIVAICVLLLRFRPGSVGVTKKVVDEVTHEVTTTHEERVQLLKESNLPEPTDESAFKACACVCGTVVLFVFLSALIIWGGEALLAGKGWAIFLMCLNAVFILVSTLYLARLPRNRTPLPFMVPFVPWVPLVSVFVNVFLMLKLSYLTWVRFAVWMVIGMAIYLFYGIRHSVEGARQRDSQSDYIPLQQVGEEDQEQTPEEPPASTTKTMPAEETTKKTEDFPPPS